MSELINSYCRSRSLLIVAKHLITDASIVVSNGGQLVVELNKATEVYHPKLQQGEPPKAVPALPTTIDPRFMNPLQRPLEQYSAVAGGNWNES